MNANDFTTDELKDFARIYALLNFSTWEDKLEAALEMNPETDDREATISNSMDTFLYNVAMRRGEQRTYVAADLCAALTKQADEFITEQCKFYNGKL